MRRSRPLLLAIPVVLLVVYMLLAPTPVEPVAWTPEDATALCEENDALKAATRILDELPGPEAILVEGDTILTGLLDGRVVRLRGVVDGGTPVVEDFAQTGGRPLGMKRAPSGALIVADAHKGLLSIDEAGAVTVLASGHDGVPFVFADDLDIAKDGTIYFSDASLRFSVEDWRMEIIEHRATGRILAYRPETGATEVLKDGLAFANGVALDDDERSLVFTETSSYAVSRLWLTGDARGRVDRLAVLPGFPDNVTWSKTRGAFLVAMGSPRKTIIDGLAAWPRVRQMVSRLPAPLLPKPTKMAMVMALDRDGRALFCLTHRSADAYTPIASVVEHGGKLLLGSFSQNGIASVPAP